MLQATKNIDLDPVAQGNSLLEQVPVIDVAEIFNDSSSTASLSAIDQISRACETWGFFQVVNHGISQSQIAEVLLQSRELFALPLEKKNEMLRTRENPWGFYNNELTKNQRDKKEVFDFTRQDFDPIYQQSNRWPRQNPQFKKTMLAYLDSCTMLALNVLEALCIGLDLPANFLHPNFSGNHTGFVRLNYYPTKDPMAGLAVDHLETADLGIHHHTDAGGLTVLLQDETCGLQVYRDGLWYNVPTTVGAMTINTGDMMQVWSNDTYKAAIHRVRAMDSQDRYSIPFFLNPSADSQISPLPSTVNQHRPARYKPINWGEFRGRRSDGDFADYGNEIQITEYRA